jgi:glycosyltransferase involved in cell wall biosynthesis
VNAALSGARGGSPCRVLVLGPVNHVHTEHLAIGLSRLGHPVTVAGEEWQNLPPSTLPASGVTVSVRQWPTARWLGRVLDEAAPDVVLGNWMPNAAVALLYGAAPMVGVAWGSDIYRASRAQRTAYRLFVRAADRLMADSADLLGQLIRLGARPAQAFQVNWGIDLDQFAPDPAGRTAAQHALGLPPGRIVLSPRALLDIYNPQTIIAAFQQVAERYDDVTLVLKHIGVATRDVGLPQETERIRVISHVPYERMPDFYRAADICVSIPSNDSSPRSVWEAMACGTPCVVSDLPWVGELIRDHQEALVVPIDPSALANAIGELLDGQVLAQRLAANGRALVVRHRNRDEEMRTLSARLEEVARAPSARTPIIRAVGRAARAVGSVQAVARHSFVATARSGPGVRG